MISIIGGQTGKTNVHVHTQNDWLTSVPDHEGNICTSYSYGDGKLGMPVFNGDCFCLLIYICLFNKMIGTSYRT